jgi:hypothetical protein
MIVLKTPLCRLLFRVYAKLKALSRSAAHNLEDPIRQLQRIRGS